VGDLQCPVRVHLAGPGEERLAAEVDLGHLAVDEVVAALADLADVHRGEAVLVRLPDDVRRAVAQRLTGDGSAVLLEGDADGWRPVA
jgi:hypothetical protein